MSSFIPVESDFVNVVLSENQQNQQKGGKLIFHVNQRFCSQSESWMNSGNSFELNTCQPLLNWLELKYFDIFLVKVTKRRQIWTHP